MVKNTSGKNRFLAVLCLVLLITDMGNNLPSSRNISSRIIYTEEELVKSTEIKNITGIHHDTVVHNFHRDGNRECFYTWDGKQLMKISNVNLRKTGKIRNKAVRTKNGNIFVKSVLKIIHWNGGSKLWEKKLIELEALLQETKPDICIISETNLWNTLPEVERGLPEYRLLLPRTMTELGHARLVALVKVNLPIKLMDEYMDKDTACVWMKVGKTRRNSLIIGGCYRQHHLLGKNYDNMARSEVQKEQEIRWRKFLQRWRRYFTEHKLCGPRRYKPGPP